MLSILFAGLGQFVLYYGIVGVVIAGSLAYYFLTPPAFPFKKTALWVAAAAAYTMFTISIGVKIEHARNSAREAAVVSREEKVSNAERESIDRSIVAAPGRMRREDCVARKAAHDRC